MVGHHDSTRCGPFNIKPTSRLCCNGLDCNAAQRRRSTSPHALLTLHRPANVDLADNFLEILVGPASPGAIASHYFPAHPRTRKQIEHFGFAKYFQFRGRVQGDLRPGTIALTDPQGYLDFLV